MNGLKKLLNQVSVSKSGQIYYVVYKVEREQLSVRGGGRGEKG